MAKGCGGQAPPPMSPGTLTTVCRTRPRSSRSVRLNGRGGAAAAAGATGEERGAGDNVTMVEDDVSLRGVDSSCCFLRHRARSRMEPAEDGADAVEVACSGCGCCCCSCSSIDAGSRHAGMYEASRPAFASAAVASAPPPFVYDAGGPKGCVENEIGQKSAAPESTFSPINPTLLKPPPILQTDQGG